MAREISLSPLDRSRFGVTTAKVDGVAADDVPGLLASCREQAVELVIARCATDDLAAVHRLQEAGFLLMDTLLLFARALREPPLPTRESTGPVRVRTASTDDADPVGHLAARAFRSYLGHYHADPRLDPAACDALYADWARRSLTVPGTADVVLVAEVDGALAGFSTIRVEGNDAHGPLDAVDPTFRRRGVYHSLSLARLHWSRDHGCERALVSTQVTNRGAQAGMGGLGFRPVQSQYTFHRWLTA